MSEKILTITIPSYNAAEYLPKCLDSMLLDPVLDDIEILVVNDGSKDNTSEVGHSYQDRYPNTVRVIDKENGGHGSGINTGIQNATGYYFKVVDADDWLDSQAFVGFVDLLGDLAQADNPVDLVASDFATVEDETFRILKHIKTTDDEGEYGNTYNLKTYQLSRAVKMHAFTVRTQILKEHYRPIDENSFYVDNQYIAYPVPYIDTVFFDKRELYMYRLGRGGQTMDIANMQRNKDMHLRVLNRMLDFYDEVAPDMNIFKRAYLERLIGDMVNVQFRIYISLGDKPETRAELKQWDEELKNSYINIYNAANKKSIMLLRKTDYKLLKLGNLALKLFKSNT